MCSDSMTIEWVRKIRKPMLGSAGVVGQVQENDGNSEGSSSFHSDCVTASRFANRDAVTPSPSSSETVTQINKLV